MQAADFRNLDHLTERRKLDRSVDGRIFFERQMRTASFVVFEIILQNPAQPGLMENNDVIQAFATDGAHQSFRKGILPRRSRRSQDFPNAHRFRRLTELLTVHAVAVAQQVTRGVVPGESLQKLTGCPFCCGVSGHREMNRTSAVLIENHKDEQELERNRWDNEEICRNQVLGVILEKGSPRLGGRFPVPDHVLGDCCLRHLNTEFQEFPMNARSAPARVGETHVPDEIPNFRRYRRATFATPTLPSPIEAKSLAMPSDNRLRFDKEQRRSPIVPQPRDTTARAKPTGLDQPNRDGAYDRGSNVARPEADVGEQESLLAERHEPGNNLAETKVESAWPGKVTGCGSVNATISICTEFLAGTSG